MDRTLGQFYTPAAISELLANTLSSRECGSLIDLAAGRGALVGPLVRNGAFSKVVCVDVDDRNIDLLEESYPNIRAIRGNSLAKGFWTRHGIEKGNYDVAVANPPFLKVPANNLHRRALDQSGLPGLLPKANSLPTELLFLAQNLIALRAGGRLAIILPQGLVTGEKWQPLRQRLITAHGIDAVISLPPGAFERTETSTVVLLLRKNEVSKDPIALFHWSRSGLVGPHYVSLKQALHRMDSEYWCQLDYTSSKKSIPLSDLVHSVLRGRHSRKELSKSGRRFVHTSDFPIANSRLSFRTMKFIQLGHRATVHALPGSIVVSRVGTRCLGRFGEVVSGSPPISDCVYSIQPKPGCRQLILDFLASKRGQNELRRVASGGAAKYLTKTRLLNLQITLDNNK